MAEAINSTNSFWETPIYTLAQSGTKIKPKLNKKEPKRVSGKGAELSNNKMLQNRAKRKMITQTMILSLIDVAKKKEDTDMVKYYWNTYYCLNKVYTSEGKLYGKYCKNRFCTLCLAIRKADIINKYLPTIQKWEDPYFVTLTVKACSAKDLNKFVKGMFRAFNQIKEKQKKLNQRGKGIKLIGIKSLECNFNAEKKTYNPHFHIIVPNKEIAETLKKEWLLKWTSKFTIHKAQNIEKVDGIKRCLMEIIKYGSKIFTEPDISKKSKQKVPPHIYTSALHNIFSAMKGYRIFDRFGFNLPKCNYEKPKATLLIQYEELIFDPKQADWLISETNNRLTGFIPEKELISLLENNIDLVLE